MIVALAFLSNPEMQERPRQIIIPGHVQALAWLPLALPRRCWQRFLRRTDVVIRPALSVSCWEFRAQLSADTDRARRGRVVNRKIASGKTPPFRKPRRLNRLAACVRSGPTPRKLHGTARGRPVDVRTTETVGPFLAFEHPIAPPGARPPTL
jgi:hypothetical protein